MQQDGGYRSVLAERPLRRLLLAALAGQLAFSMLPLGFVLFGAQATGSTASAGALVAGFTLASALAPLRGRIVDRFGSSALTAFAGACAAGIGALVLAAALDAPTPALVVASALAGLAMPPLGAYVRAALGLALHDREPIRQRAFALDSAGEEGALIVAPLLVAVVVALASPSLALLIAAAGLLAGTVAAGRTGPGARAAPPEARSRAPAPAELWWVVAALVPPAAALGAVDVAVPAAARAQGEPSLAGVLLAAMAVGTVAGSLLSGRRAWRLAPERRLVAFQVVMGLGLAAAALAWERPGLLGLALLIPGAAVGALFATLYVLVDHLTPVGSGTRIFAWLVTANNAGIALGAALGGALSQASGASAGLWLAAVCALLGAPPAIAAAILSARGPGRGQTGPGPRVPSDKRGIRARQGNGESRGGP